MDTRQRILTLRLIEKIKKNPSLAKELGIEVKFKTNKKEKGSLK